MINPQLGIDTWEGQLEIDESILKSNDVKFMFIRLNSIAGGHHKDDLFDKQWAEASGFYRAPYFVYNPWVTGKQNFDWLMANIPADAKAVGIDIEVRKDGYSPTVYANEFDIFCTAIKNSRLNGCIYTGEWFLPMLNRWPVYLPYWWAQYPNEFYTPGSPQRITWDQLRQRLLKYEKPFNASKVPGQLICWQFSGDTLILPGNNRIMDACVFYGDMDAFFGGKPTGPGAGDVVSYPYNGVERVLAERFGRRIYVTIFDPKIARMVVKCEDELPSKVCQKYNAQLAWNGDDWDRATRKVFGLAVSDGKVCNPRTLATPSLGVLQSGTAFINHANITGQYNVSSGVRYLVRDGKIQDYLYGTDPKYTEKHARSINGLNSAGDVIHITIDGDYPNQGITLLEAAKISIEFGATIAFDAGGGGDSVDVVDGIVVNVPDDDFNGVHYERRVPQTILVFAEEKSMPTTNGRAKEKLGNSPVIRKTPSRYGVEVTRKPAGWETEFVAIVDAIPQGSADKNGELWLQLPDGNFVNYKLFSSNALLEYFTILEMPTTDPDPTPTPTVADMPVHFEFGGGDSPYELTVVDLIIKAKPQ